MGWSICGVLPALCMPCHPQLSSLGMTPRDGDRLRTTASTGTAAHPRWKLRWGRDHQSHSKGTAKLLLPPHFCLQPEHTRCSPSRLLKYWGARCLAGNLFMLP